MIARGLFSFCPPRSHVSSCFPSKSFVSPTCKFSSRNSFVSPTYAKTGGVPPQKCRRADIFSPFSQSTLSPSLLPCPPQLQRKRVFNHLRTLSFSVSHLSRVLPRGCALFHKKTGVHPLVIPIIEQSHPLIPQILEPSLRSALCALCVSAVSLLLFPFVPLAVPPCPTTYFPLQWEIPFPVTAGENQ